MLREQLDSHQKQLKTINKIVINFKTAICTTKYGWHIEREFYACRKVHACVFGIDYYPQLFNQERMGLDAVNRKGCCHYYTCVERFGVAMHVHRCYHKLFLFSNPLLSRSYDNSYM
jgi:hypothetical protein